MHTRVCKTSKRFQRARLVDLFFNRNAAPRRRDRRLSKWSLTSIRIWKKEITVPYEKSNFSSPFSIFMFQFLFLFFYKLPIRDTDETFEITSNSCSNRRISKNDEIQKIRRGLLSNDLVDIQTSYGQFLGNDFSVSPSVPSNFVDE